MARRLVRVGERQGLDAASLLRRAGLPASVADPSGGAAVTISQVGELTQELWILTGDELFGLGPPVPLGAFQLMMRSVIHVPDLRAALQRLAEAGEVLGTPRLRVTAGAALVEVEIDVSRLDDPDHLGAELLATVVHRVLGWLVGRRIALRELRLPWPSPRTPRTTRPCSAGTRGSTPAGWCWPSTASC